MGVRDIVALSILWAMSVGAVFALPATWRGTNQETIRIGFSWWPMGRPSLRSLVRTVPVDFFAIGSGTIGASFRVVAQDAEGAWRTGFNIATSAFFGLAVLALFLGFTIFMFNTPKLLVAPHLRDEKGFFGMWGDESRERREQRR